MLDFPLLTGGHNFTNSEGINNQPSATSHIQPLAGFHVPCLFRNGAGSISKWLLTILVHTHSVAHIFPPRDLHLVARCWLFSNSLVVFSYVVLHFEFICPCPACICCPPRLHDCTWYSGPPVAKLTIICATVSTIVNQCQVV